MIVASVTAPAHTRNATPLWQRARKALTGVGRQGAKMASAARHRYRRPALVISAFGCLDAAAWTTFGLGAGLAVLGGLLIVFEWVTGGDE